jgi:hypothetical protein
MRTRALALKGSSVPFEARLGGVLFNIVDISTSSGAEKHNKIKRLPVSMVETKSVDGRQGTVKNFVARGKTHFSVFVPAPNTGVVPDLETIELSPGPNEGNSSGTRNEFDCYGGEPEPCATQQEMDDFMSFLAYQQSEMELIQIEVDAGLAEIENYCSQNPWECEEPVSGPSDSSDCFGKCTDQAVAALVGAVMTTGEIILAANHMAGAYVATGAVSSGFLVGSGLVIGATAFMAGYAFGTFLGCKLARIAGLVLDSPSPFVEPEFAS